MENVAEVFHRLRFILRNEDISRRVMACIYQRSEAPQIFYMWTQYTLPQLEDTTTQFIRLFELLDCNSQVLPRCYLPPPPLHQLTSMNPDLFIILLTQYYPYPPEVMEEVERLYTRAVPPCMRIEIHFSAQSNFLETEIFGYFSILYGRVGSVLLHPIEEWGYVEFEHVEMARHVLVNRLRKHKIRGCQILAYPYLRG